MSIVVSIGNIRTCHHDETKTLDSADSHDHKPTDAGCGQGKATKTDTECSNPDQDKSGKWYIDGHIRHMWAKYPKVCKSTTSATAMTPTAPVDETANTVGAAIPPT